MEEKTTIPSITVRTRKILWGRSGNRCALCEIKLELIEDIGLEGDTSIVGDEAHIIAKEIDGPRGREEYPMEKRNDYDNLVLLCKKHHKIIDDHPEKFSVEFLRKMKSEHEEWVKNNLGIDKSLENDIIIYLTYLEFIEAKMNFDNWANQCSSIIGSDNITMTKSLYQCFIDTYEYIQGRIWPKRYKDLEILLITFAKIILDFLMVFEHHLEKADNNEYCTRKFYQISEWNPEKYNRLIREHNFHNYLLIDLLFELTRVGNKIIDLVRSKISYFYRIEQGALLVKIGNNLTGYKIHRIEYQNDEQKYSSLKLFSTERQNRDYTYEEGNYDQYIDKYIK
ncbi:MAG: HNH endonuclease signature motif containing protein [Saprospiraceae bacterium]